MDNICPCSISILVDDSQPHVHKGRTDSEDFVHFVCQVDGYSLGDYFEHFEPPDNSFRSYILIRQLPSFMSERWLRLTPLSNSRSLMVQPLSAITSSQTPE